MPLPADSLLLSREAARAHVPALRGRRPLTPRFCHEKRHAPMYLRCVPALQFRRPWPFPSCCKLLITHGL